MNLLKLLKYLFLLHIAFMLACTNREQTTQEYKANPAEILPQGPTFWARLLNQQPHIWQDSVLLDQAMADYLYSLRTLDSAAIAYSLNDIKSLVGEEKNFYLFWDRLDFYVYHPNSPMRNDEQSLILFKQLIQWPAIKQEYKVKYEHIIKLLSINRVGAKANDFTFVTENGSIQQLYTIQAPWTLVLFYDPSCHTCATVMTKLKNAMLINDWIREKKLTIVSVNVFEQMMKPQEIADKLSPMWVNGWDKNQQILKKELYNLQAYPTIYVMDKDKRVVLKDVPIEEAAQFIQQKVR